MQASVVPAWLSFSLLTQAGLLDLQLNSKLERDAVVWVFVWIHSISRGNGKVYTSTTPTSVKTMAISNIISHNTMQSHQSSPSTPPAAIIPTTPTTIHSRTNGHHQRYLHWWQLCPLWMPFNRTTMLEACVILSVIMLLTGEFLFGLQSMIQVFLVEISCVDLEEVICIGSVVWFAAANSDLGSGCCTFVGVVLVTGGTS